ncbi:hypothetical protein KUTeg_003993 [Tegillarca granosa]|uniref:Uncharacterized protein n=1 Tax=Tegillarca granosa TaxID=220873 RepID=A0ABQ9FQI7_TEGGR|nr:hypothetical protein KUTeg_003993 [Tegillarca granosa]
MKCFQYRRKILTMLLFVTCISTVLAITTGQGISLIDPDIGGVGTLGVGRFGGGLGCARYGCRHDHFDCAPLSRPRRRRCRLRRRNDRLFHGIEDDIRSQCLPARIP